MRNVTLMFRFLACLGLAIAWTVSPAHVAVASGAPTNAPAEWHHAKGTFEVTVKQESETRFAMSKSFSGALAGTSKGTMIADNRVTAYAALERFDGTLDGRNGSFVLLHRGIMSEAEGMKLDIVIASNSGSGELVGIRGALKVRIEGGRHYYDLAYTLPRK